MNLNARLLAVLMLLALVGCTTAQSGPAAAPAESESPEALPVEPISEPEPLPTEIAVDPSEPVAAPGVLRVGPEGTDLATAPGGPAAGRLRGGVLVPFSAVDGGWARITTPCDLARWMPLVSGVPLARPVVVLDPGHGGNEPGAVGPGGLQEKEVNLDVVQRAAALLNSRGIPTLTTLTSDYRATIQFRVAIAREASADLMVSVHYNADPDGPLDKPGTETYYQFRSADSKRLAGLIYEEVVNDLSRLDVSFVGDTDAGAKWRLGSSGGDYYGILRRSGEAGVTTVLAELAFITNPAEEEVLRRDEIRHSNAEALVRGIERYLGTEDPGSGFTTPYPRTEPAGPGGGASGCVDPA